jgi:hypothetical protein
MTSGDVPANTAKPSPIAQSPLELRSVDTDAAQYTPAELS